MAAAASQPSTYPLFVASGFAASGITVGLWWQDGLTMRHVLVGAVLARLVFFPLLPSLSDDAFRYVWDGLIQIEGFNPYLYLPTDEALATYRKRPVFEALNSARYYSVYPPLSQLLFAVGGLFGEGGWRTSYYVIKGLFVLMELGGVWALSHMVSARSVLLYAWQPLVIVETAGQAHTEAGMVGLLLLTVWAVRSRRAYWAGAGLAAAGMIKLYPFVLFPLLWRRFGWQSLLAGGIVTSALALPYAAPEALVNMMSSLRLYVQLFEFNAGPYFALKTVLALLTGQDWSKQLGPLLAALFLLTLYVIYRVAARNAWRFERGAITILGAYLALSTTVHPWYLVSLVALAVLFKPPSWHWLWLSTAALGTYLFYVDGPYWSFVILGWLGASVIAIKKHFTMTGWLRRRAEHKVRRLAPWLSSSSQDIDDLRVLDLGAGEGYVGAEIQKRFATDVQLADVIDLNQTALPHVRYDGHTLPMENDTYDVVILYFVLHHAEDAERVLSEALRVSQSLVLVVESVCESPAQCRVLRALDIIANRIRSSGKMAAQETHLQFRTVTEWRRLARRLGAEVTHLERFGNWVHPQVLMALTPLENRAG